MKKFFALCALLFALSSCLTVERIKKHCDDFAQVCNTGTETVTIKKDTTIFRHDTILFNLPESNIFIKDTIYIENNQAKINPVNETRGLIWVKVRINNNCLNINTGLTDSTILMPDHDTIFLPDIFSQTTTTNTITEKVKFIPKFYKFCFWFFIIQVTAAAFFIAGYLLRFKIKLLKFRK